MIKYGKCKVCGELFRENGELKFGAKINSHLVDKHRDIFEEMRRQHKEVRDKMYAYGKQLESEYSYVKVSNTSIRRIAPMKILSAEEFKGDEK